MRNETKIKAFPHLSLFPGPTLLLHSKLFYAHPHDQHRVSGNKSNCQFTSASSSSPHTSPSPSCDPFRGIQFFMSCSSVGPFHWVQSFRIRLTSYRVTAPAKKPAHASIPLQRLHLLSEASSIIGSLWTAVSVKV